MPAMQPSSPVTRRAALAALGALALTPQRLVAQPAVVTIRAGHPPTETATPALYAIRAGLFDRAGIALTIDKMASGAAVAAAVAGGGLDIGGTSLLSVIIGYTRGIPFTIISAANNMWYPEADGGLMVQAGSPYYQPKDFVGKTISAAAVNDIVSLEIWAWMEKAGADWRSVKIVEIPQPAAQAALDAGRVDGIVIMGSAYAAAMTSPKVRLVAKIASSLAPRFANTCWFSTRNWVEKNHDAAAHFARVMSDASAYVDSHPDETLKDLLDYTGIDRAAALRMRRALFSTTLSPSDIQPVITAAAKFKMIDKDYPAAELFSNVVPKA